MLTQIESKSAIRRIVGLCVDHAWLLVVAGCLLGITSSIYSVRHFSITTDVNQMISPDLPWRQREKNFESTFPQAEILAVVEAPSPELTDLATSELMHGLSARPDVFRQVRQLGGGPFFERNALLFLPTDDVTRITKQIVQAEPIIGTLTKDPSVRGELAALQLALTGVQVGQLKLDDLSKPLEMAAVALESVLASRPATFSWQVLSSGRSPEPRELRRFIAITPKLDFAALAPGLAATDAVKQIADTLKLADRYQAQVRLTGQVPIADDQFATLKSGTIVNSLVSVASVLIVLWLALSSLRTLAAVALTVVIGLAATAALGLWMVGSFNLISIAFAALFVGLGVDFGIQFSVRYRAERHDSDDIKAALISAGNKAGKPLALAAGATMIGFFSFLPTAYRGVAELGQIAGCGMLIAFALSITFLPALLRLVNPPPEPARVGFSFLAPVDRFLARWRISVIVVTFASVALLSPLLLDVRFDFNPLHLSDPKAESVAAFLDLRQDPDAGTNAIDVVTPSLEAARAVVRRVDMVPDVLRAVTIDSFVPDDQNAKLAAIAAAASATAASLGSEEVDAPPSDAETIQSLNATAQNLQNIAGTDGGPGATRARRLAEDLTKLAGSDSGSRARAAFTFVEPLKVFLHQIRQALHAQQFSVDTLPDDIRRQWVAPDGRFRVEILPKGDSNDDDVLRKFVDSVLKIEPSAVGPAVSLVESGRAVMWAFIQAGLYAFGAIALLLWLTLRRIGDVVLTLVPLLLAGIVTMEIAGLIDLPLNFANIIALPLLLGVGVAFKIYYIMAWRAGRTNLLQSTLTRAVSFSAMTTGIAFGSLWFSKFPGTSSMGQLMALELVCTLAAAVLFQPVLMGPPRLLVKPAQSPKPDSTGFASRSLDRGAEPSRGRATITESQSI